MVTAHEAPSSAMHCVAAWWANALVQSRGSASGTRESFCEALIQTRDGPRARFLTYCEICARRAGRGAWTVDRGARRLAVQNGRLFMCVLL